MNRTFNKSEEKIINVMFFITAKKCAGIHITPDDFNQFVVARNMAQLFHLEHCVLDLIL